VGAALDDKFDALLELVDERGDMLGMFDPPPG
jgi:hypothetical protein